VCRSETEVEEHREHEQYFFDQATVRRLADFLEGYDHPLCLCAPLVGAELSRRGVPVRVLDIDRRFADLPGFRFFDLQHPKWVGEGLARTSHQDVRAPESGIDCGAASGTSTPGSSRGQVMFSPRHRGSGQGDAMSQPGRVSDERQRSPGPRGPAKTAQPGEKVGHGIILCDPPFFGVSLSRLFKAVSMLAGYDFRHPLLLTYLRRRKEKILEVFEPFALRPTGFLPAYESVPRLGKFEVEFYGNLPEEGPGLAR